MSVGRISPALITDDAAIPRDDAIEPGLSRAMTAEESLLLLALAATATPRPDKADNPGASSGELFDEALYRDRAVAAGLPAIPAGEAREHWVRFGIPARIVPTRAFDDAAYVVAFSDVAAAGLFGFRHFIEFGRNEGRDFTAEADPVGEPGQTSGAGAVAAPDDTSADESLIAGNVDLLRSLFVVPLYLASLPVAERPDPRDAFDHFLASGLNGYRLSPLFDAELYAARAADAGLPAPAGVSPILHWLRFGVAARIVPCDVFDEEYYRAQNHDVREAGVFGFVHWLLFGSAEFRAPSRLIAEYAPHLVKAFHPERFQRALARGTFSAGSLFRAFRSLPQNDGSWTLFFGPLAKIARIRPEFSEADAEVLAGMFVPEHYAKAAGLPITMLPAALLEHFIGWGLWDGIAPTLLFDPDYYLERIDDRDHVEEPLFLHWLMTGRQNHIVPTLRFDAIFYRWFYSDMRDATINTFQHFVLSGVHEGRSPNALFAADIYRSDPRVTDMGGMTPYLHFLAIGADSGIAPSIKVGALWSTSQVVPDLAEFDRALNSLRNLRQRLTPEECEMAVAMFAPRDQSRLETSWQDFLAFLDATAAGVDYASPLFDPALYVARAREAGLAVLDGQNRFLHFLAVGMFVRIVPTALFSEEQYHARYRDLSPTSPVWSFTHFVQHGIFEGRLPCNDAALVLAPRFNAAPDRPEYVNWLRFCRSYLPSPEQENGRQDHAEAPARHVVRVMKSPLFAEIMRRAQDLEPEIGDVSAIGHVLYPPLHDPIESRHLALKARFATAHYENIVCIPWLRMGGADLVACVLAGALARISGPGSTLLLQVDQPNVERRDWLPPDVDLVDMSDIVHSTDGASAERILSAALLGLSPKRVFNVNSRVCWTTLERFGRRLSDHMDIYAYLFCWDQTNLGSRAGYPSEFYPVTADFMTGVFTDTHYLKGELARLYAPPAPLVDRITPLFSPVRSEPAVPTVAEAGVLSAPLRTRPRVLWGARLDRQKRFDLVLAIAARMPGVEFLCWGAAVLDPAPDMRAAPPNLTLNPPFAGYDELPLEQADVWLFTSEWEGMPTMLIELGNKGVPIVASAVGGVPEVITPDTGWPIAASSGVEQYVAALEEAIADAAERIRRGSALQALIQQRHSPVAYEQALRAAIQSERA